MNPCPCGYLGDPKRECRCTPAQIQRYCSKISGPLLDRIDIHVEVPAVTYGEMTGGQDGESSAAIRERVLRAREIQMRRGRAGRPFSNGKMTSRQAKKFCVLEEDAEAIIKAAMESLALSARAYTKALKVARTIADLDGAEAISAAHMAEAIQYRRLDRGAR